MLLEDKIEYKWHNATKSHFEAQGYVFTFRGDTFYPEVRHLPKTSTNKIKMSCDNCGIINYVTFGNHLRSVTCKEKGFGYYYCSICTRQIYGSLTHDEFTQIVSNLTNDEYLVKGVYLRSGEKVNLYHVTCGRTFSPRPRDFIHKNSRCPYCYGKMKKTTDEYIQEVRNLVGDEYVVLSEYINSATKIKKIHLLCGETYFVTPNDFLDGCRCPKCMGKKKITENEFITEVRNLVNDEYTVLGTFVNKKTKIEIKHNRCDFSYYVLPYHFLNGVRCPKCNGKMRRTTEEFISEVTSIVGNEYSVLGNYKNSSQKIKMKHNTCEYEWHVEPNAFLNGGSRCPKCASSKGEKRILDFFVSENIRYVTQYKFDDCRNKNPLPFDFAVINDDDTIKFLVEFDGVQHFKSKEFFGGEKGFRRTKKNDEIKDNYCIKNNIKLMRIPYWKIGDIDKILSDACI